MFSLTSVDYMQEIYAQFSTLPGADAYKRSKNIYHGSFYLVIFNFGYIYDLQCILLNISYENIALIFTYLHKATNVPYSFQTIFQNSLLLAIIKTVSENLIHVLQRFYRME